MSRQIKLFFQMMVCFWVILSAAISSVSAQSTSFGRKQPGEQITIELKTPGDLQGLFRYTGKPLNLVSAHRGGAREGFPENCIATFENTLRHTAAVMEVDPRYTKDKAIVLHHDAVLERTTNGRGRVSDFTLAELKQLKLTDSEGNITKYSMPTLDEALEWARGKTVLILDRKGIPIEDRVRKIQEHNAEAYAMVMAYTYEEARECYKLNKNIMMEIFIKNQEEIERFEKTDVPWSNVVVFVGHSPPKDAELYKKIHAKGAICIEGTSRNLDLKVIKKEVASIKSLGREYRTVLEQGADVIETDIPIEVGQLLFSK